MDKLFPEDLNKASIEENVLWLRRSCPLAQRNLDNDHSDERPAEAAKQELVCRRVVHQKVQRDQPKGKEKQRHRHPPACAAALCSLHVAAVLCILQHILGDRDKAECGTSESDC